jgi:CBS-domain-containing membrane protein
MAAVSIRDTDAYFETLKRELALSVEQASAMRAILDRTRDEYKTVCADVRPRYDVLRERARHQMRALVVADQQERFDSIVTQEDCRCPEAKK